MIDAQTSAPKRNSAAHLLDYYHCTFFLPLIGLSDKDFKPDVYPPHRYTSERLQAVFVEKNKSDKAETPKKTSPEEAAAQAYRYFSPALRDILFDVDRGLIHADTVQRLKLDALQEWRIPAERLATWELHLCRNRGDAEPRQAAESPEGNAGKTESAPLIAQVDAVTLYRYFNGVYLLAFRVSPKALKNLDDKSPLYNWDSSGHLSEILQCGAESKARYEDLKLEEWLNFTRLARIIYPSFPEQNDEKKIAPLRLYDVKSEQILASSFEQRQRVAMMRQPGEDFSPILRFLLKQFTTSPGSLESFLNGYTQLYDDRMFVSVAYGLAGRKLPDDELNRLFYLMLYADRHEDTFSDLAGHVYTPSAIEKLTQGRRFDLWQGMGGVFGFTDTVNAYMYQGSFFRDVIAPIHIPYIYDRMLIQALLYQASLRYYDNQIAESTLQLLDNDDVKSIQQQRKDFIHFTNRYWFHDLTDQMQGKMIFQHQQEALGLKKHYEIIKDELERTDDFLQTRFEQKVTWWGLRVGLLALYYAACSVVPDTVKNIVSALLALCPIPQRFTMGLLGNIIHSFIVLALVPLLSWLLWHYVLKPIYVEYKKNKRAEKEQKNKAAFL